MISGGGGNAVTAPVRNVWASKKVQTKGKTVKGKKTPATKKAAAPAKKRAAGTGAAAAAKRPRPAGSRTSSRHPSVSPVFADTVRTYTNY